MEQVRRIIPEIKKKPPAKRFVKGIAITQLRPRVLTATPVEREELKALAAREAIQIRRSEIERLKQLIGEEPAKWLEEHIRRQAKIYRLFEEYQKKERAEPVISEIVTAKRALPVGVTELPAPLRRAINDLVDELERQARVALPAELRAELRALRMLRKRLEAKRADVVALARTYMLSDSPEVRTVLTQADAKLMELGERIRRKEEQIKQMEERRLAEMAGI